ncbi:MAG TPA: L-rhamnose mutarotase [Ginsengibacter sp.]|nr:L-rhamnose mutarotase [Ginsengibacter sp.]
MKTYCLTLDLKNDPELISEYEEHHKEVWPEIIDSIKDSGIINMQIYRYETRLFMIMQVDDNFSFERKQKLDIDNPKVQEWEALMWKYQQPLLGSEIGEKWKLMDKIFDLKKS